jgi:hypothetical protein
MTQQEIQERNEQIALMLGFKYKNQAKYWGKYPLDNNSFLSKLGYVMMNNLKFHSDWNWIMEAVEFIEKIYNNQPVYFGHNNCVIFSPKTIRSKGKDKKEAVFIAVSDFAKLYNNKQL